MQSSSEEERVLGKIIIEVVVNELPKLCRYCRVGRHGRGPWAAGLRGVAGEPPRSAIKLGR